MFLTCSRVQGSLLFVTYTIIQGIISSEMLESGAIPNVDCTTQRRKRKTSACCCAVAMWLLRPSEC